MTGGTSSLPLPDFHLNLHTPEPKASPPNSHVASILNAESTNILQIVVEDKISRLEDRFVSSFEILLGVTNDL
jgi:hypothetical protein